MVTRLVVRLLLIQALWNYRTMLGAGLAWVLMPDLREIHGEDEEAFREALQHQAEHFNAHPYMAGFAAGALVRLAREGEDAGATRRFRNALRGPLGSLGDALFWSGWVPLCVLGCAAAVVVLDVGPVVAIASFLVIFNALHLLVRWWGVSSGLHLGRALGQALRRVELPLWAERMGRGGVFLVGLLAGFAVTGGALVPHAGLSPRAVGLFTAAGVVVFLVGWFRGRHLWWWTPVTVVGAIVGLLTVGSGG